MINKAHVAVVFLVTMVVSVILPPASVFAAEQTITVPTIVAADDPIVPNPLGDMPASSAGVNLKAPLNDTATQVDDAVTMAGLPTGYTWRVAVPTTLCEGARKPPTPAVANAAFSCSCCGASRLVTDSRSLRTSNGRRI